MDQMNNAYYPMKKPQVNTGRFHVLWLANTKAVFAPPEQIVIGDAKAPLP